MRLSTNIAPSDTGRPTSPRGWGRAAAGWCLVFAVPHFFWALGGRAGLGAQAAAAEEALATPWFFAYNLMTGVLAVGGALVALMLANMGPHGRTRRLLRASAWGACALLLLRGAVGVTLLGREIVLGTMDSPPLLAAVEPWFVLGGVLFGVLARQSGRGTRTGSPSP